MACLAIFDRCCYIMSVTVTRPGSEISGREVSCAHTRARTEFTNFFRFFERGHFSGKKAPIAFREFSAPVRNQSKMPSAAMIGRPARKGAETAFGDYLMALERRFCIVPASPLDKIRAWSILKNCRPFVTLWSILPSKNNGKQQFFGGF